LPCSKFVVLADGKKKADRRVTREEFEKLTILVASLLARIKRLDPEIEIAAPGHY
jgi:hypothetical protein